MGGKKMFFGSKKVYEPNTFIGGIAKLGGTGANAPILTASELATTLGLDENVIKGFRIVGEDVECHITVNFTVTDIDQQTYSGAFYENSNIVSFNSDKVVGVGDYSFTYCTNLASVYCPLLTSIGYSSFYICSGLTSVYCPLLTSIGDDSFYGCTGLTSIDLPLLANIGYASFYSCTGLTSIDLPSVTSIRYDSFYGCSGLTSIDLPSVTSIGYASFYGCTGLESINIPLCKTLGNDNQNNSVFYDNKLDVIINSNIFLKTANAGGLEGDLLYAYQGLNATINFYDDNGNFVETYEP